MIVFAILHRYSIMKCVIYAINNINNVTRNTQ